MTFSYELNICWNFCLINSIIYFNRHIETLDCRALMFCLHNGPKNCWDGAGPRVAWQASNRHRGWAAVAMVHHEDRGRHGRGVGGHGVQLGGPVWHGGMIKQWTDVDDRGHGVVWTGGSWPDKMVGRVRKKNREGEAEGSFRFKNFLDFDTVILLFLFDKHCLIIE